MEFISCVFYEWGLLAENNDWKVNFQLFPGLIGYNQRNLGNKSNLVLNRLEDVREPLGIKRFGLSTAGKELRLNYLKNGNIMAVMGYSTGLKNGSRTSFHASLVIVTASKEIFIYDPQVCDNKSKWRQLQGLKKGLEIHVETDVNICYGDQSGTLDCLQRVLKVGGLLLDGHDFRNVLNF